MDSLSPSFNGAGWSNLPLDLMYLVFERLGFVDFQRAKSVCSSWRCASKQSARPNNHIPWMIRFPERGQDYCLLFNPEEEEKPYRIQGFGVNFAKSYCLATYGSWFFMRDPIRNLYLLNLFTRERIGMPPLEYQLGLVVTYINSISLWMDEKTKDYLVVWTIHNPTRGDMGLFYCRKDDTYWKQFEAFGIIDMVYKDRKLYLYTKSCDVKVLDFSEDTPRKIFKTQVSESIPPFLFRRFHSLIGVISDCFAVPRDCLVIAVTGELLRVVGTINNYTNCHFSIYKMDLLNSKWEKLTSLGDEAIILDLRISVLAKNIQGVKRNSIYFSSGYFEDCDDVMVRKDTYVFSLDTNTTERPDQSMLCSSIPSSDSRWFVPN